jgi:hypothetical protein
MDKNYMVRSFIIHILHYVLLPWLYEGRRGGWDMDKMINTCKILDGKSERKGPHGKPRHRWKDNIKRNL